MAEKISSHSAAARYQILGLCRHFAFKDVSDWKLMSSRDFRDWIFWNENILPEENSGASLEGWDICFSSDLPRAKKTAEVLSRTIPLHIDAAFREIPFHPFSIPLILPKGAWLFLSRLIWLTGFRGSLIEPKQKSLLRAKKAARFLSEKKESKILVVTHGFFMHLLTRELRCLDFSGSVPTVPKYGKIYMFTR